jgi:hypothetical protein
MPALSEPSLVNALATALDEKKQHHDEQNSRNYPDDNRIVHLQPPFG